MKKRFLSLLLALILMAGIVSTAALAEAPEAGIDVADEVFSSALEEDSRAQQESEDYSKQAMDEASSAQLQPLAEVTVATAAELSNALAAIPDGGTIKLTANIEKLSGIDNHIYNSSIGSFEYKSFTIDLNGNDLSIDGGINISGGKEVAVKGQGTLTGSEIFVRFAADSKFTSADDVLLDVKRVYADAGGFISVGKNIATAVSAYDGSFVEIAGDANRVTSEDGSSVTVNGNVTASGYSNYAIQAIGSTVNINGDVTTYDGHGINADNSSITIGGDVTYSGYNLVVSATGSTVKIGGNVTASNSQELNANNSSITIDGDVAASVYATGDSTINVGGDVSGSVSSFDGAKVYITGDVLGQININYAGIYIYAPRARNVLIDGYYWDEYYGESTGWSEIRPAYVYIRIGEAPAPAPSQNISAVPPVAGASADITRVSIPIASPQNTNSYMSGNWARISPISQFVDNNDNIGFAYGDDNNVYIEKLDGSLNRMETLTIAKRYPQLGAVTCDDAGFYYIVWGQDDRAGNGGVETIAVSKYDNNGNFIKTAAIVSSNDDGLGRDNTRYPFGAAASGSGAYMPNVGNCAVAIYDGVLVCNYGRGMYNGHQSNAVIAVNTADMSLRTDIDAYTSHSMDQRVIYHNGLDSFMFADHGDGYPRGFCVRWTGGVMAPFTFYEEPHYYDDMYLLNYTGAQLGGIGEVSTGIALVGSSAMSYSPAFWDEQKQLFIQIINPDTRRFVTSGIRTDADGNIVNNGVMWLTNYGDASAENPQMVGTDDDRIIVMWEKFSKGWFDESYYMVISAKGEVLQGTTPIGTRLNAFEEPHFIDGYVYWVTANEGNNSRTQTSAATINKMRYIPPMDPNREPPNYDLTKELVTRMYENVLLRDASLDPDGLNAWTQRMMNRSYTGAELAFEFYFSVEFLTADINNEAFIDNLYRTFFGRDANNDPAGKGHWLGQADAGMSRLELVAEFIGCEEFRNVCKAADIDIGRIAPKQEAQVRGFVWGFYYHCFGRAPDEYGLNAWTERLIEGDQTGTSIAREFVISGEMRNKIDAGMTDEAFVVALYTVMLGRAPDDEGREAWTERVSSAGGNRHEWLFEQFAVSEEFGNVCTKFGITR